MPLEEGDKTTNSTSNVDTAATPEASPSSAISPRRSPSQKVDLDVDEPGKSEKLPTYKKYTEHIRRQDEDDLIMFYRDHPIFYDQTRADFKKTQDKTRLLEEFGANLGYAGELSLNCLVLFQVCTVIIIVRLLLYFPFINSNFFSQNT